MEIPTVNELETQLFKAIRDGNLQEVQALIKKGRYPSFDAFAASKLLSSYLLI